MPASFSGPKAARGSRISGVLLLTVVVAALGGVLFGFDTTIISGAMLFLKGSFHLSDTQLEFAVGIAVAGAMAGSLIAGPVADRWGRRRVLLWTGYGFVAASLLSGAAWSLDSFVLARFLVGAGIGIVSLVTPLYIAEMAPAHWRGRLVMVNQLALTSAMVAAYMVGYRFAPQGQWRMMFFTSVVPAAGLVVGMLILPESPRWLARRGNRQQALANLARLGRGAEAGQELARIEPMAPRSAAPSLLHPRLRRNLLVGIGVALLQQLTGINAVFYYAPSILRSSGYGGERAALHGAVVIGAVNAVVTLVALLLIDQIGRRPLLLISLGGMAASLALTGAAFHFHLAAALIFFSLLAFVSFFGVGLGSIPWVLIAEIYPLEVRGKAMSVATFWVWTGNWMIAGSFLTMQNFVGIAETFWLFGAVSVAGLFFCWAWVPETRGKSLEEIEQQWG